MSTDYQFLAFQDAALLREVGLYQGAAVATLDVRGNGFKDVAEVQVNGILAPEFIVLSQTRLLAQIPESQLRSKITSVSVLLSRAGVTPVSILRFKAFVGNRIAEGRVRLLQNFFKILFTEPGSDLWSPNIGGGLYHIVGSSGSSTELKAQAAVAITSTQNQLVQLQAKTIGLSNDEKLRAATLLGIEFDKQATALRLRVRLTAVDGSTTDVGFAR